MKPKELLEKTRKSTLAKFQDEKFLNKGEKVKEIILKNIKEPKPVLIEAAELFNAFTDYNLTKKEYLENSETESFPLVKQISFDNSYHEQLNFLTYLNPDDENLTALITAIRLNEADLIIEDKNSKTDLTQIIWFNDTLLKLLKPSKMTEELKEKNKKLELLNQL